MKTFSVPLLVLLTVLLFANATAATAISPQAASDDHPAAYGEGLIFEVASIKPAPPREQGRPMGGGCSGGPETKDPSRWACENMSALNLVRSGFNLKGFQLQVQFSMDDEQFNITAKIPEGATKEQFRQMQQNLLIERFGLKFHREKKEMQGYELAVVKNGPKFKESMPEPPKDPAVKQQAPPEFPFKMTTSKDGFPVIPTGVSGFIMTPGHARGQWIGTTMGNITEFLSGQTGKPVTNSTGLDGKYDVSLEWAPEQMGNVAPPPPSVENSMPSTSEPTSAPSLFSALQEQLGLKLLPKKVTIEIFIIDHIEKTPTEN